jgi:hypothetical protein
VGNGTSGFFTITLETTTQITDSATITVFPIPTPVMSQSGNTFVVAADDVSTVVWYLNGNALSDSFESSLAFTEGGLYYAEVTNSFGCSAVSNSILYCAPVTIEYDAGAGELSVDDQYESYEWFYNGLPLDGASNSYLAASDPGNYMVEVTTDYGCTTESQVYVLELNVAETKTNSISAYPNPAENAITFKLSDSLVSGDIAVFDIVGKKMAVNVIQYNGSIITLEVTGYPAGVYFTRIGNNNIRWIRK